MGYKPPIPGLDNAGPTVAYGTGVTTALGNPVNATGGLLTFNATAGSIALPVNNSNYVPTLNLGGGKGLLTDGTYVSIVNGGAYIAAWVIGDSILQTSLVPSTSANYNLGISTNRWNNIWNVNSDISGTTTLGGALITTPEALTPTNNATGVPISFSTVASGFALNGNNTFSLANGTNGQIKVITCTAVTAVGTGILTPTTRNNYSTVTFSAAGHAATLQYYTVGGWSVISVRGAVVA